MNKAESLNESMTAELLKILKERFAQHIYRHESILWENVESILNNKPQLLWSINRMEVTGGEPDIVVFSNEDWGYVDCAQESPLGRRSMCYDEEALTKRKKNPPENDVMTMAQEWEVSLLSEHQYHILQSIEPVDLKTSSWLLTPNDVRTLGGAIFGDRRYGRVFIYHNGADSYYASRGFRGFLPLN